MATLSDINQKQLNVARSKFELSIDAEKKAHDTARTALAEIYKFAVATKGTRALRDECESKQITVRSGSDANDFLLPIKMVISKEVLDSAGNQIDWTFDSQKLARYANICYHANNQNIKPNDFLKWLEDEDNGRGNITKANVQSQQSGNLPGTTRVPVLTDDVDPLDFITDTLGPRWSEAVNKPPSFKIDMNKAGVGPGLVQFISAVDENGDVRILGVIPADGKSIVNDIKHVASLPKPQKLLALAVKMLGDDDHQIVIYNTSKVTVKVDKKADIELSSKPDPFLPSNTRITLDKNAVQAILHIDKSFKDTIWEVDEDNFVVSVPNKTIEQAMADVEETAKMKWLEKKQIANDEGKIPPNELWRYVKPGYLKTKGGKIIISFEVEK